MGVPDDQRIYEARGQNNVEGCTQVLDAELAGQVRVRGRLGPGAQQTSRSQRRGRFCSSAFGENLDTYNVLTLARSFLAAIPSQGLVPDHDVQALSDQDLATVAVEFRRWIE